MYHRERLIVKAPTEELQENYDIAFSLYYKFKWFPSTTDMGRLRGWWHSFAGFTEVGSYAGAGWEHRTLSIFFIYWAHSVGFHNTLYDYNCNRDCGNYWKNAEGFRMEDIQGSWTKVYYGYSHAKRSAFIYFSFEKTGKVYSMEWTGVMQNLKKTRLEFILGGLYDQYHPAPGLYQDVRVYWNKGSFIGTRASVENYF